MQTFSQLYNSKKVSRRSVSRRSAVKKTRVGSKNISSNMRPLRSRNAEVNTKEDPSVTIYTRKAEKVPTTSFISNLETKVALKKMNSTKATTSKRNPRKGNVMTDESSVEKENRPKKLKTAKCGSDELATSVNTSTPKLLLPAGRQMNLREHVNKNYRESSLVRSSPEHKVPIYLQKLQNIRTKKQGDPYEPDFASEDRLQKRRDLSEQYDETYHELLLKLEKKEAVKEKKEAVKKKKAIATSKTSSYKENLKNVMERIMKKVNEKKQKVASTEEPKTPLKNKSPVPVEETKNISYHSACQTTGLGNAPDIQIMHVADGDSPAQVYSSNLSAEIISQALIPLDLHSTSQIQLDKSYSYPQVTKGSIPLDFCKESQNQVDKPVDCPQVTPKSIIHDFCNDSRSEVVKPVGYPYVTYKGSPFRITCFRPSPYYMYCKPNALPCLHQDLIMDYDFVMKFGRPPESKLRKKLVQSNMLNYIEINGNKENALKAYTLYDIEEFHIGPVENVREVGQRVLRSRMEPNILVSTPKKAGIEQSKDIAALDISVIQHEEGATKGGNVVIEVETYRRLIESTGSLRQYTRNSVNKPTDDSTEETGGKLFDGVDPEFLENVDDQVPDLKGKKRRNQFVFDETMVEDRHRKRKKDEMNKEEKKQFEKWAKEFNKMCAEVEKHQLQIV